MLGLRTNESDKFIKYFEIVQATAQKQGCVYYLDAGDGLEFETEVYEGEDLMGWLIPDDFVLSFEKEWNQGDVSDEWSKYYTWAIWSTSESPTITFKHPFLMTIEAYKYIISRVLERAFESIHEADQSKDEFQAGRKLAYYEIADIIKSELCVRDADLSEFGLDVDLEKAFGGNQKET